MSAQPVPTRDERRRRTEAAILTAAVELFAETGFERTTIRAVAARAGIDPALVMQHYGSKEQLFTAAARWAPEHERVLTAAAAEVPAAALEDFFGRFEDSAERLTAAALLRACLTHPGARDLVRDEVMRARTKAVAQSLGGDDEAELRAGLLASCMIGLALSRFLLEIPPVASASRADIERIMLPALSAVVDRDG